MRDQLLRVRRLRDKEHLGDILPPLFAHLRVDGVRQVQEAVVCVRSRIRLLINDPVPLVNMRMHAKLPSEQQQLLHKFGRKRRLKDGLVRACIVNDSAAIVDNGSLHANGFADGRGAKVAPPRRNGHIHAGSLRAANGRKVFRRHIVGRQGERIVNIQHKKSIHYVLLQI